MVCAIFWVLVTALFLPTAVPLSFGDTNHLVTARRGEALQISCRVQVEDGEDIEEVRWYLTFDLGLPSLYGSINTTGGCGAAELPCPVVNTTDDRGQMRYVRGDSNDAKLILDIREVDLEDEGLFRCSYYVSLGTVRSIAASHVSVDVYYLPNATYPVCTWTLSSSSTLSCQSEKGNPTVSLAWTASANQDEEGSLPSHQSVVGDRIVSELNVTALQLAQERFTCRMTSEGYPDIDRSCSLGPFTTTTTTSGTVTLPPRAETHDPVDPFHTTPMASPTPGRTTPATDAGRTEPGPGFDGSALVLPVTVACLVVTAIISLCGALVWLVRRCVKRGRAKHGDAPRDNLALDGVTEDTDGHRGPPSDLRGDRAGATRHSTAPAPVSHEYAELGDARPRGWRWESTERDPPLTDEPEYEVKLHRV